MRLKKYDISVLREESKFWPKVCVDILSDDKKDIFINRKNAVDMYINGDTLKYISEKTNIKLTDIPRLIARCMEKDSYGNVLGYVALIPYKRINEYYRSVSMSEVDSTRCQGAFLKLMRDNQDLETDIISFHFGLNGYRKEKNPTAVNTHKRLIKQLIKKGFIETDYPFNTKDQGLHTLRNYLKTKLNLLDSEQIGRICEDARQKLLTTGLGNILSPRPLRPLSRIEIDGHKIDALFIIKIIDENGDERSIIAERLWIITAMDVGTRTVLGYSISISRNYNQYDVLQCIENCIVPHKIISFKTPHLKYPNGCYGYHSLDVNGATWATIDEICFDNAKAHLAESIMNLPELIGCTLNFGPVATPERRPFVERFFRTLEEMGFHRLPSTTGSNVNDIRKKNAAKNAIKYEITLETLIEICEVLFAQYNAKEHSGLKGFSPLDIMRQRIERGLIPNYIEESKRKDFCCMKVYDKRTIRGNIKCGTRPYISFNNLKYSNKFLATIPGLIGKEITLEINPNDIRIIKAYYQDGSEFGDLFVLGKVQKTAISIRTLQNLNKHINQKNIELNEFSDPVGDFVDDLKAKALKNRGAATQLANIEYNARLNSPESILLPENKPRDCKVVKINSANTILTQEELEARFKNPKMKTRI